MLDMAQLTRIHHRKTPPRIHYIAEWAERRQLRQTDIARELEADKSSVSRWFAGLLPEQPYIIRLAALLELEEPNDLFRHPDDDWFRRMFRGESREVIEDSKKIIELHLRRKLKDSRA